MNLTLFNVTSHSVVLSWQPSPQRNGIIRKYDVTMMKRDNQWMSANISDVINNTRVAIKVHSNNASLHYVLVAYLRMII